MSHFKLKTLLLVFVFVAVGLLMVRVLLNVNQAERNRRIEEIREAIYQTERGLKVIARDRRRSSLRATTSAQKHTAFLDGETNSALVELMRLKKELKQLTGEEVTIASDSQ